jgi:outer membrane lipoprotein
MRKWLAFLMGLLFTVLSCAPFPKELMKQVDLSADFRDVQKSPEKYIGKTVIWGGFILETLNRQEETDIRVLQGELDSQKRPISPDQSSGRFIIRAKAFLDPAIYREGREITVLGEIGDRESLPLGQINYTYPIVLAKEIRLWEPRGEGYPPYPYGYWRGPYSWPWYGYPYPYPYRHRW